MVLGAVGSGGLRRPGVAMTDLPESEPRVLTLQFLGIVVAALLYFMALDLLLPVVAPYMKARFRAGDVAIGIAVGAFAVGAIAFRPFIGRVVDRSGRRLIFIISTCGIAMTILLYIVASGVASLTIVRFFSGVAEAGAYVGIAAMAADRAPVARRGEAMAYFSASIYVSLAFGPFLGEAIYHYWDATAVWVTSAVLLFMAAGIGLLLDETLPASLRSVERVPLSLVHRRTLAPAVVMVLSILGPAGFFAFIALYTRSIGMEDAAPVLFVYGGVVLFIRVLGARLFDRFGGWWGTTLALASTAVGFAVIWVWETPIGLYAGTIILAIGGGFLYTSMILIVLDGLRESERGVAIGTFASAYDLGFGVGAPAAGLVAAGFGYGAVFAFGAVTSLAALAAFQLLLARRRRPVRA